MASQPIWSAAGQRGEGGPDLVRRDTCPVPVLLESRLFPTQGAVARPGLVMWDSNRRTQGQRSWARRSGWALVVVLGLALEVLLGILSNWAANHPEQLPKSLQ